METKKFKVFGLRIEKYLKQTCFRNDYDYDFEYGKEIADKNILLLLDKDNEKYELELYEEQGECSSGYTTASWAYAKFKNVKSFKGFTHKIIKDIYIDLTFNEFTGIEDCENEVFEFSFDGGDSYYPMGYYQVNVNLFRASARAKDKMPIWIFIGASGVGKSYIASHLKGLTVFETDSYENLPDKITERVIVLGNKYNHTIQDVKDRIKYDCEIHVVEFK